MLISSCAVVERMVTECGRKLKAPVVKQKSFELERKGGTFFQAVFSSSSADDCRSSEIKVSKTLCVI